MSANHKKAVASVSLQPDRLWDPGGEINAPALAPNPPVQVSPIFYAMISAAMHTDESTPLPDNAANVESRMELDSHANMPVAGCHSYILSDTGRTASVSAYNPDYPSLEIKIVDAAVSYQCKYTGKSYILVLRNALHVPTMVHNLIPPFIMRECGIIVNDRPKLHTSSPTTDDHAIKFDETFQIPLLLSGVFSYFPSKKPTLDELQASEEVYLMTPEDFDPHSTHYAVQEESYVDWEGHVIPENDQPSILLTDVPDPSIQVSNMRALSPMEQETIDLLLLPTPDDDRCPLQDTNIELAAISSVLCERTLYERLEHRQELSTMMASIGSCHSTYSGNTLLDDGTMDLPGLQTDLDPDLDPGVLNMNDFIDQIVEAANDGQLDLDDVMVSSTYAKPAMGVQAAHLSKI